MDSRVSIFPCTSREISHDDVLVCRFILCLCNIHVSVELVVRLLNHVRRTSVAMVVVWHMGVTTGHVIVTLVTQAWIVK